MPAYEKPMTIIADVPPRGDDSVAAVIRFKSGPEEMERIQAFLARLAERGIIEPTKAKAYDSSYTSAELYFP